MDDVFRPRPEELYRAVHLSRDDRGLNSGIGLHFPAEGAACHQGIKDDIALRQIQRLCDGRSEEHTSELQSLMRISYAVFCLKKKKQNQQIANNKQAPKLHAHI